tara:strand:+ start:13726 stop:13899 length:174 start_codon:yes stop_codon:yes gene_type:complete
MGGMTTMKKTWVKQAKVAKREFAQETQHKRSRFAVIAIGLIAVGVVFVALALGYPYL